ncbi:hypothetical protein P879_02212 [Paragonimus westermani]|uniref:Cyclin-like domain-containing protein n=1 Tax=Paragonimus westermani TaxID=34504 RepID=A0A8T0DXD3_9TREM|nr:hypothetical protein P879_02212 [Paragonimus westermani]
MARSYWRGSHYLEWLLDRQDVMAHRVGDLKLLGSEEEYQKVMIFFAEVIQAFGKSVEVRQQVIATATVYFKRFFSRNSFKTVDAWLMAPSCLFLASKVEEFGMLSQKNLLASCRNVVHAHYSAYFPDGFGYPYRAQDVLECEFMLLEAMDCSLIVFHPYRPLVLFCEELRPQLHELADLLLERAWWIVNDSYRTDVCLYYPPYLIALGCLQTAFVLLANNTDLLASVSGSSSISGSSTRHTYSHPPQPSVNPLAVADRWFSELNVDMEKVLEVTRHLLNLYDLWRRYDEATEMPNILLKKLPRPVVQPPPHTNPSSGSCCLQTAFVLLANNTDLLASVSGSSSISGSSTRHTYSHPPQPSVNPLAVADRWFSELNVDMEKVLEVTRHLLNLYDLWRRYDEATEMPNILLKKLPRPVVQPPPHTNPSSGSCSAFPNASTTVITANPVTGAGSGASQSSASCGAPPHGQMMPSSSSVSGGAGVGSGAVGTGGGSNNLPESQPHLVAHHPQVQPNRTAGVPVRMHSQQQPPPPQGMQHLGLR